MSTFDSRPFAFPKHQPHVPPSNAFPKWTEPPLTKPAVIIGKNELEIHAGPILRYIGMSPHLDEWIGSALVVTSSNKASKKHVNEKTEKMVTFAPTLFYKLSTSRLEKKHQVKKSKHASTKTKSKKTDTGFTKGSFSPSLNTLAVFKDPQLSQTTPTILNPPDSKSRLDRCVNRYRKRKDAPLSINDPYIHFTGVEKSNLQYDENDNHSDNYNEYEEPSTTGQFSSELVLSEYGKTFWRFRLNLPIDPVYETRVDYWINNHGKTYSFYIAAANKSMNTVFYSCNGFSNNVDTPLFKGDLWSDVLRHHNGCDHVERAAEHTCASIQANDNDSTDDADTNDANSFHFHVMLGGGDQIYCDMVFVNCPSLLPWLQTTNLDQKLRQPFTPRLQIQVEQAYLDLYLSWFGQGWWQGPNSTQRVLNPSVPLALASIPSINIWDDHDTMDGFGSYAEKTMKSPVIKGIGNAGHKYYMLFQHHSLPDEDPSKEPHWIYQPLEKKKAASSLQYEKKEKQRHVRFKLKKHDKKIDEKKGDSYSSYGSYLPHVSQSIYARLGKDVAFVGIDCRTERTATRVVSPETYKCVFARLQKELGSKGSEAEQGIRESTASMTAIAAESKPAIWNWPWSRPPYYDTVPPVKHLYVMLGIPASFPRVTIAEAIFKSKWINPIKYMAQIQRIRQLRRQHQDNPLEENIFSKIEHKISNTLLGGLVNQFDGEIDYLDDLTDRWTCPGHADERAWLIQELQKLAKDTNVRITILSGDIHMAAMGRFCSVQQAPESTNPCFSSALSSTLSIPSFTSTPFAESSVISNSKNVDSTRILHQKVARNYSYDPYNPLQNYNLNLCNNPTKDHRLMLNVISSAITNSPPGKVVIPSILYVSATLSNYLTSRMATGISSTIPEFPKSNFISSPSLELSQQIPSKSSKYYEIGTPGDFLVTIAHKLESKFATRLASTITTRRIDNETHEDMINLFKVDTDESRKFNQILLPRRNWCSLCVVTAPSNDAQQPLTQNEPPLLHSPNYNKINNKDVRNSTSTGKRFENSFTSFPQYPDAPGAVSIVLHVEKDATNPSGETRPYEIIVPILDAQL